MIEEGAALAKAEGVDAIVGLGGSALDAAKRNQCINGQPIPDHPVF